jgi:pimeloyl-ACP methyl ester carboxylesterase
MSDRAEFDSAEFTTQSAPRRGKSVLAWCMTSRKRILAIAFALLVVGWLSSSSVVAWVLTHRVHPRAAEFVPADLQTRVREVRLTTSDGEDIGAWIVAGEVAKPMVILLHGLGGNRTMLLPKLRLLADRGYGVVAVTLRASGDSSGKRNDIGWSARHDVVAAVAYLEKEYPGRKIVIDGASMGAAAAMFAARELAERVQDYVLECPYRDLPTAVRTRLALFLPPVLDRIAWAGLRTVSPIFFPELDDIRPIDTVEAIPPSARIVFPGSLVDDRVRPDELREIRARVQDRSVILFHRTAPHDRLVTADPRWWENAVKRWLFFAILVLIVLAILLCFGPGLSG